MSALSAAASDEDGDTIKTLQARVADLEAQLYAVGAGGVGKLEQPQSVTNCHQSQPQGEQEPVAWIEHEWSGSGLRHLHFERPAPTVRDEVVRPVWTPLYTHPQPPRQPLTDEAVRKLIPPWAAWKYEVGHDEAIKFARAVEAAHGIGGEK